MPALSVRYRSFAMAAAVAPAIVLAYQGPAHAARPQRCDGRQITLLVASHSPHLVRGTSRADVIEILAAGHVIYAGAGNDVICGSSATCSTAGTATTHCMATVAMTH